MPWWPDAQFSPRPMLTVVLPPVSTSIFTLELPTARFGELTVSVAVKCAASLLMLMLVVEVMPASTAGEALRGSTGRMQPLLPAMLLPLL